MRKNRVVRHEVTQPLDKPYRFITLTQNQNAKVDKEDFPWLDQWNWYAQWDPTTNSFYAMRTVGDQKISMAREILGCGLNEEADHKNHDTLDNRRQNLREATQIQNISHRKIRSDNTSGRKGVVWDKSTGKWHSRIRHNGIRTHLGLFTSVDEAARAYDEAAKRLHGEFAVLNFPETPNLESQ